jgi:hypothetical protein
LSRFKSIRCRRDLIDRKDKYLHISSNKATCTITLNKTVNSVDCEDISHDNHIGKIKWTILTNVTDNPPSIKYDIPLFKEIDLYLLVRYIIKEYTRAGIRAIRK